MKLSARTLTILKNFGNLNPGIIFVPGQVISLFSQAGNGAALARVEEEFPSRCAITNLQTFINVLTSFDNPSLSFKDKYLTISQENRSVKIVYGEESFIYKEKDQTPPTSEDDIELPETIGTFSMNEAELKNLIRVSNAMHFPNIAVVGENGILSLQGIDPKNVTGDVYKTELGEVNKEFRLVFTMDQFNNLLSMDYDVNVSFGGLRMTGKDVTYWLVFEEQKSTYGK